MKKNPDFLTTSEAAESLSKRTGGSVSVQRVQAILKAGGIPGAVKIGRDWLIPRSALAAVKVYGKPGRPRQEKNVA